MLHGAVVQERFAAVQRIHLGQMGFQRRSAVGVQARRVHGHVVEIADLLRNASFRIFLVGDFLNQAGQGLGVLFPEFREGAPGGILRQSWVKIDPVPRGVLRKVIARTGRGVHVVVVDAGIFDRFRAAGGYDQPRCCQEE